MTKNTPTNNGTSRPIYVVNVQFEPGKTENNRLARRQNDQKLNDFAMITRN